MALNEIYAVANSLSFPVASTVVSGDLVQVGEIVGIAEHDAKVKEDGNTYATLKLTGAFKLETADAFAEGDKVYVTALGVVTDVATSNKLIGHAIKSGTGYVVVRLQQN
jgi:predicted RecA/RadA family phage recombinase